MTVVVVLRSHSRLLAAVHVYFRLEGVQSRRVRVSLAGCVHSSVNKPGVNGRVGYESLTHCTLYCRDREKKVGHESTRVFLQLHMLTSLYIRVGSS